MSKWNIDELLSIGESVVYKCVVEDEGTDEKIHVYITNYRIIWINRAFVDCRLLRFISKYGTFEGYNEYHEDTDLGTGEYGVYFGDLENYESFWFYSEKVWKDFYSELSRAILEE